ncbi:hypothetical protein IW262DRAFT_861759 [Armillaria fumosa]|nr:hypothetical protein IW262DRAFT_861759 [Armillaria fumosa]
MNELDDSHYQRLYDTYWKRPDVQLYQKSRTSKYESQGKYLWVLQDPSGFMEAAFDTQTVTVSEEYMRAANSAISFSKGAPAAETAHFDVSSPPCNPFQGHEDAVTGEMYGFSVNGRRRLGKSVWLCLILIWRLQCGLTTAYASYGPYWVVFSEKGFHNLGDDISRNPGAAFYINHHFGDHFWFLVDTTAGCYEGDMPAPLLISRCYLVQATTTRWIRWKDHCKTVRTYKVDVPMLWYNEYFM